MCLIIKTMIIIYGLGGEIGTGLEILSLLRSEEAFTGTKPGQLKYLVGLGIPPGQPLSSGFQI